MARSARLVLVDGSWLVFRAFFAIPANLSTSRGLHTNAILGFANTFRKIMAGRRPEACTAGTRKGGEGCRYHSQCESVSCTTQLTTGTCGTCATLVEAGAACDFGSLACPNGEECVSSHCVPYEPPAPAGATCSAANPRCEGTSCLGATPDASAGTCAASR
jgi:hypothetical protein